MLTPDDAVNPVSLKSPRIARAKMAISRHKPLEMGRRE
jgi:hypothetical protein